MESPDDVAQADSLRYWTLRFFLQATDDPSLLAPAAQVWRAMKWMATFLNRRFEHLQERFLADLRRASKLFLPVENRLSKLWSIMEFLNSGYLSSQAEFRRTFAITIERYSDEERSVQLKRLVQPFVLRRVKTDPNIINDLPEKIETKVFCHLTKEQATLYGAIVRDMMQRVETSEGIERRGLVLSALLRLKQVCNHPAQFLGEDKSLEWRSGKLRRLVELLDELLSEGDKALIFSQFAEMGHLLKTYLQQKFGGEVLFIHGGTPRKQRDEMIEWFQSDRDGLRLFILSLKAGGFGLNLTAANHVFHFDR